MMNDSKLICMFALEFSCILYALIKKSIVFCRNTFTFFESCVMSRKEANTLNCSFPVIKTQDSSVRVIKLSC
jgi:hypothetical protein